METEQRLKHIEEISKNARATWFSLLIALLFCGVTLLDVKDRDFFAYGAATKLPVIGVEVPVVGFFLSAPVLVLALYLYLHVYLAKLWRALAPPFAVEDAALDDHVYPWLLADTALRLRPDMPKRDFGWLSTLVSLVLGWAFAPFILGVFWVRSWPYHHEWLTLFLAGLFVGSLVMAVRSYMRMHDWMLRDGGNTSDGPFGFFGSTAKPLIALMVLGLITVSWEKTEGPVLNGSAFPIYSADLYRLEFVQLPDDWEPRDLAWQSHERTNRETVEKEIRRDPPVGLERDAEGGFDPDAFDKAVMARLKEGFRKRRDVAVARLRKDDWKRVDLRRANLRKANLSGLDLQGAQMEGANLTGAQMEGANLRWAQMEGAYLRRAQMEGAYLFEAQMEGANLSGAQMEGANLSGAQMEGADLRWAQMEGANLSGAQMEEAYLIGIR